MTSAEAFREIDRLAAEVQRRLDRRGYDKVVRDYLIGIQVKAQDALQDALANQSKLEAFDGLLGIAESAVLLWAIMAVDIELPRSVRLGAAEKAEAAREIIAEAKETTAPESLGETGAGSPLGGECDD